MVRHHRRGPVAFYRTPVLRWAMILTGGFAAFGLWFGPETWRQGPAVLWISQLVPIPVTVAALLLYVALAATRRTFLAACLLGMGIYGTYTVAVIVITIQGQPSSALGVAAFVLVVAEHYAAARRAEFDRNRP